MEIKTILCLILHAHACFAISNDSAEHSVVDNAITIKPDNSTDHQPKRAPSGRSFAIKNYLPLPGDPSDETDSSSNTNTSRKEIVFLSFAIHSEGSLSNSKEERLRTDSSSNPNKSHKAPSGRSFAIKDYPTLPGEPIDFNMNETDSSSNTNKSHKDARQCNDSDPNEEKCLLEISDEAVDFLKGLLFTRLMPSFYILIILISLPLNTLALVAFTCRIQKKKPAVIYMCNLACVDLLFTLLLPLKIHYQLNASDWVFGEAACRVLTAAYYCYMYCSILLMMCMSVDRLLAVAFPVVSLTWRSARKATFICTLVWLLALAGTVPLLSIRQTFEIKDVGVTCHDALKYNDPTNQLYLYLFFILSCLYYFVPLIVTLVSYFKIIHVLRAKSNRLSKSPSWLEKRRRASIMLIALMIEFVVCFAPTNGILLYHCVRLATGGNNSEGDSSYAAYLLAVCLGSVSVFLDPLLYYYGSSQCREKISSLFWWRKAKTTFSRSDTQSGSSFVSIEYSKASVKM